MTHKQALQDLLAGTEAGEWDRSTSWLPSSFYTACRDALTDDFRDQSWVGLAWSAYRGSLAAAKTLHDAMLPDREWMRTSDGVMMVASQEFGLWFPSDNENPARAWLIAILKAMIGHGGKDMTDKPNWQPIETAPKDGTEVLGYAGPDYKHGELVISAVLVLSFFKTNGKAAWRDWDHDIWEPTHWMPLPRPPWAGT